MSIASIEHTIAIMSTLNKVIKENDGSVTHFHLSIVSSKIMETQTAKRRVEQVLENCKKVSTLLLKMANQRSILMDTCR